MRSCDIAKHRFPPGHNSILRLRDRKLVDKGNSSDVKCSTHNIWHCLKTMFMMLHRCLHRRSDRVRDQLTSRNSLQ